MARPEGPWARRWESAATPGQPDLDLARERIEHMKRGDKGVVVPQERRWIRFHGVPSSAGPVIVDIQVGTDENGRLATYGIGCSAPLTSTLYDSLPQDALRKAAANVLSDLIRDIEAIPNLRKVPKAQRHGDEFLAMVAAVSRSSLSRGLAVQAVMDACDVSQATAQRYIRRAQEAGHQTTN
jgi:hypothetical protein